MRYGLLLVLTISVSVVMLFGCTPQPVNNGGSDSSGGSGTTLPGGSLGTGSSGGKDTTTGIQDEIQHLEDGTPYLLHPSNILSGGPPKDGIPSIDDPIYESVEDADWLNDDDLVLGLHYKGVKRAYPLRILNWHEIVNDFVGNERVLVTYCPLCRTGIAFDPTVDNEQVEFGTSGKLYNSELIMYDRKTDSYWTQTLGKAVLGDATGQVLKKIALDTVQWKDWKATHPDTEVLSRQTGFIRDYDRTPYTGYDQSERIFFPVENDDDDRFFRKAIVFGVEFNGQSKAYTEDDVEEVRLINDEVGGVPIVVVWDPNLNTVKIFERDVEFTLESGVILDEEGNEWTADQMAEELKIVDTFGHFWFSWASFFPETEVYQP